MTRRVQGESGFALLLVFVVAAAIGLSLYLEMPRLAMDSQRAKEQLLIDRGEQYKRAIQLFVRNAGRYPMKMEELESFNNKRFLRRRYVDPMTGKDEWRIVHIGPGGVFTDSVLNKASKIKDGQQANQNTFITEFATVGSTGTSTATGVNLALRRRASEGGTGAGGTAQGQMVVGPDGKPIQPTPVSQTGVIDPNVAGVQVNAGTQTAATATLPAYIQAQIGLAATTGVPVQTPGMPGPVAGYQQRTQGSTSTASQSSVSTLPYIGSTVVTTTQPLTGAAALAQYPRAAVSSQTGGVSASPYSTVAGSQGTTPPIQQPGLQIGQTSNEALNMIQRLLTTPRAAGTIQTTAGLGVMQIAPGSIAGVASTLEQEGVIVYGDRTAYNEWEFIYDYTKERKLPNPNAGTIGTAVDRMSSPSSGSGSSGSGSQIFTPTTSSFGSTGSSQPSTGQR